MYCFIMAPYEATFLGVAPSTFTTVYNPLFRRGLDVWRSHFHLKDLREKPKRVWDGQKLGSFGPRRRRCIYCISYLLKIGGFLRNCPKNKFHHFGHHAFYWMLPKCSTFKRSISGIMHSKDMTPVSQNEHLKSHLFVHTGFQHLQKPQNAGYPDGPLRLCQPNSSLPTYGP